MRLNIIIALSSMIIPLITGITAWQILPKFLRLIVVQIAISLLIVSVSIMLKGPNHGLFNIYMILDFSLVFFAVYEQNDFKYKSKFHLIGACLFIAVWSYSVLKFGIDHFANHAHVIASLLIAIAYFLVLLQMFTKEGTGDNETAIIILCLATLMYCCTIPLFSFLGYILNHFRKDASRIYDINTILSAVKYLLLAYCFFIYKAPEAKSV